MHKTSGTDTIKHLWVVHTVPCLCAVENLDAATNLKGNHCIDKLYFLGEKIGKEL